MAIGDINCGICGFSVHVEADCPDGRNAQVCITSTCPSYEKIAVEIAQVDVFLEVFQKLDQGKIFQAFKKYSNHPSCPGLSGILKTIEVAAGLALAQEASLKIKK